MPMPPQLQNAKRPKRAAPRPLAECLPRINVNDLKIPKRLNAVVTVPWISFKYPFVSAARLSANMVEFAHSGRIQSFRLKWIKTGYGLPRFAFVCQCGRPVISLYLHHGNLACRRCCNAIYASQVLDQASRPALQTHRIQTFLKHKPSLWHRTRQRLQARSHALRAKSQRVSKRITAKAMQPQTNYQSQACPLWR